jgi:hypothetical protein
VLKAEPGTEEVMPAIVHQLLMLFWGLEPSKRQPPRALLER